MDKNQLPIRIGKYKELREGKRKNRILEKRIDIGGKVQSKRDGDAK